MKVRLLLLIFAFCLGGCHRSAIAVHSAAPPSPVQFVDVAAQDGLHYQWSIPGPRPLDILQTIGNGCAFLDYNNSGNLSILLVGTNHVSLYQGDGHGHFVDVSHQTHLDRLRGHFLGCAVGDYDNDGYDDIYLSGYRTGVLLHNVHGQYFQDVTQQAGLKPQPWGTSCAWGDIDGSGRLSLYVGNYVVFDPATSARLTGFSPDYYAPEHGVLYQNLGGGHFKNVTAQWHAAGSGKALGVAFADDNGSGRQSLAIENDRMPGDLLQNEGKTFQNVGRLCGVAYDGHFHLHGGMGVDWGDYDNDGRLDLAVMAFRNEPKCVYHNLGGGRFADVSDALGLTPPTLPYVAFGCKWADFTNDGWLDLMIANGHVYDDASTVDPGSTFRQPTQVFLNQQGTRFANLSDTSGAALQERIVGRGLAVGDFLNTGRMDALVVNSEGAPLLLQNVSPHVGHFLCLTLVGTHCNRDGYGSLVVVKTPGLTQTRLCHADGSYLSSSDKRVHVGLGAATVAQSVQVQWPDGHVDTFRNVPADHFYAAVEGAGHLRLVRS